MPLDSGRVTMRQVSILVVVDRARWAAASDRAGDSALRFQSLLWWIGLAGDGSQVTFKLDRECFNPCCGGSGSLGLRDRRSFLEGVDVSILVVVDRARWGRRPRGTCRVASGFNPCCGGSGSLGLAADASGLAIRCFNPCCGGSGSLGMTVAGMRSHPPGFNPCCGGSGSLGRSAPTIGICDAWFQSLLWWIGLAGTSPHAMAVGDASCFNPCCGGSGSLGLASRPERLARFEVSILVVVDRARWDASMWSRCRA